MQTGKNVGERLGTAFAEKTRMHPAMKVGATAKAVNVLLTSANGFEDRIAGDDALDVHMT